MKVLESRDITALEFPANDVLALRVRNDVLALRVRHRPGAAPCCGAAAEKQVPIRGGKTLQQKRSKRNASSVTGILKTVPCAPAATLLRTAAFPCARAATLLKLLPFLALLQLLRVCARGV